MSTIHDRFDDWLEQGLRLEASVLAGPNPLPSQARYRVPARPGRLYRIFALASAKALTGVALTVMTAAAAGAATEAIVTGTVNPVAWMQQGIVQVERCSAALGGGGFGQCAGTFSLQHGNPRGEAPGSPSDPSARAGTASSPPGHQGGPPTSHPGDPPAGKGSPTDKGGPPATKAVGPPASHPGVGPSGTPPGKPSPGPHPSPDPSPHGHPHS
jgi:hypothetical protein